MRRRFLYFALFFVYIALIQKIKCPFLYIFNVKCPTCGMTRAIMSLFHGNIGDYIKYNAMAIPVCMVVMLEIHKSFFMHGRIIDALCILTIMANLVYYLLRF